MQTTVRKPATPGEILVEEFLQPLDLTQGALTEALGVPRKHVNELCNDKRSITVPTALMLARVFGNSAEFWMNVQRRSAVGSSCVGPGSGQVERLFSARHHR